MNEEDRGVKARCGWISSQLDNPFNRDNKVETVVFNKYLKQINNESLSGIPCILRELIRVIETRISKVTDQVCDMRQQRCLI